MSAKDYSVFTGTVYVKDPDTIIAQGMEFTKVVRCRDCVNCEKFFSELAMKDVSVCRVNYEKPTLTPRIVDQDDFCKWGERDA